MPSKKTPIVIIGAGGIVNDAHLPAYQKAGFEVRGIYDIDNKKLEAASEMGADKILNSKLNEPINSLIEI